VLVDAVEDDVDDAAVEVEVEPDPAEDAVVVDDGGDDDGAGAVTGAAVTVGVGRATDNET